MLYEGEREATLPFARALSCASFTYSNRSNDGGGTIATVFTVTSTGVPRICWLPQPYLAEAAGDKLTATRLEGVVLKSGKSQDVKLSADPWALARFDSDTSAWRVAEGTYWRHLLGRTRQIS